MKRRDLLLGTVAATSLGASQVFAQTASAWPAKPVKIVHGFPPGGPVDALARLVAAQFPEKFGQQAVVEGRAGAGGTIGAASVAKSQKPKGRRDSVRMRRATGPGFDVSAAR